MQQQSDVVTPADYARILRRRWPWVLVVVLLSLVAGMAYLSVAPKEYSATASLIVTPTIGIDSANASSGRTSGVVNLDTEAQIVRSTPVAVAAAKAIGWTGEIKDLVALVDVTVPANTTVLQVSFLGTSAQGARDGAHAFAQAYLDSRQAQAKAAVDQQIDAIQTQIDTLNAQLAKLPSTPSDRPEVEAQRAVLQGSILSLAQQLGPLKTTQITPGTFLTDATVPTGPVSPDKLLVMGGALALGLILGIGLALLVDRVDRRIRRPGDVAAAGAEVLVADLGASRTPRLEPLASDEAARYAEVRAAAVVTLPTECGVVLVAPVSPGVGGSVVAANLAASFARSGSATVLVSTYADAASPRLLGARDSGPTVSRALKTGQPPRLDDVPSGVPAVLLSGEDLPVFADRLHGAAMDQLLGALKQSFDIVVIDVPSLDASRMGLSLARFCDEVVLVVEERRTTRVSLRENVNRLQVAGVRLLGAVLLQTGPRKAPALPPPAAHHLMWWTDAPAKDPGAHEGTDAHDVVDTDGSAGADRERSAAVRAQGSSGASDGPDEPAADRPRPGTARR